MIFRWPWTSCARLDDAVGQIEWLRTENAKLADALVRMERVEHGMSETPRVPRPEPAPMPRKLEIYLSGMATPSLKKMARSEAIRRNRAGQSWDDIVADVVPRPGEEEK